jgi:DNA repair exonuclease SbcCD ATPase subunit
MVVNLLKENNLFISNLSIKDFKNIKDINFDFKKINVIAGETGEGKSAIIEALTFLQTNYLSDKIEEYIRWNQKKFVVSETFKYKSKEYFYKIIGGKTTDRELKIGSEDYYKSDAVKQLSTIIDPDLTLYSNISLQHKSTELLFEKPTPRLQKIKPIFKVDKINEKVELIKSDIKEINLKIETLETEVRTLQQVKIEYLEEPSFPDVDIKEIENKLSLLEEDRKKYQIELQQYEKYKEKLRQYEDAQKTIKILNEEIEFENSKAATYQLKPVKKINEDEFINKSKELDRIKYDLFTLETEIKNYKAIEIEKADLQNKIEERTKLLSENTIKRLPRVSITKEQIEDLENSFVKQKSDYLFLLKKLDAIKNGNCPTCGSKFEITDVDLLKNTIKSSEIENKNLEDQIILSKKQIKEREDIEQENKIIQSRLDIWNKDIVEFSKKLNEVNLITEPDYSKKDELLKIQEPLFIELKKLEEDRNIFNKVEEENKIVEKKIKDYESKILVLQTKIEENTKIQKPEEFIFTVDYKTVELQYNTLKTSIDNYYKIESEIKKIQEYNDKIKEQKKKIVKDINTKENDIITFRNEVTILKETASILDKDFSSYLIDLGSTFIKNKMNNFFQKGYGKYQIDLKQDGKGIEFFYSENKGVDWHSVSMLSGFEKQLFGVAFRIALTKLQDLNFLFLDEIDSDASDEKSLKLYQTLLNENFDQLFLITHNNFTKEYFSNISECKIFEIKNGSLEN